jgi:hypothetical protein
MQKYRCQRLSPILLVLLLLPSFTLATSLHHLRPPPLADTPYSIHTYQQNVPLEYGDGTALSYTEYALPPLSRPALSLASTVSPVPIDSTFNDPQSVSGSPGATFDITWSTSCATPPAAAVTALDYAAGLWGTWISSTIPIEVRACWATNLGSSTLGTGMPSGYVRNFAGAPQVNTDYPRALANALNGSDLHPELIDMRLEFNANLAWSFAVIPESGNDFISVALHELAHGLGFIGNMYVYYSAGWCGDGAFGALYPCPTPYDRLAVDSSNIPLLDYQADRFVLRDRLQGDAHSGGPNTRVANDGAAAKLYTPPSWQHGSSLSHLDLAMFGSGPNRLMSPTYAIARHPGPVTLAMLQDMGWLRADGVPNVSTIGPLIVGVGHTATFTGTFAAPGDAGQPMTYTWAATDHAPLVRRGPGSVDIVTLSWSEPGEKALTITVDTGTATAGVVRRTLAYGVELGGPAEGKTSTVLTFHADVVPDAAGQPVTFTWEATGQPPVVRTHAQTSDSQAFTWSQPGLKTVTVTASVAGASARGSGAVEIVDDGGIVFGHSLYLPLAQR